MSDRPDSTRITRPRPKRPLTGLIAWEATVGYISSHYSPDALLKLQAYPLAGGIAWAASVSWADHEERVRDLGSLPLVLEALWLEVSRNHVIFQTEKDAQKAPEDYAEDQWLDPRTRETVSRLVRVTNAVFTNDWLLMVVYQPVEVSTTRVQARLLAHDNTVHIGGRGAMFWAACHDLYANAAPIFASSMGKHNEND